MLRTWATGSVGRTATASALTAVLATACVSEDSCFTADIFDGGASDLAKGSPFDVSATASCAAGVEYQGRFYVAWSAKLPVAKGHLLGDAVYPACNDWGGCGGDGSGATGRPTQVWAMRGVDPGRVVVARREGTNRFVVFGRLNANPGMYFRFARGTWHIRDGLDGLG